MSTSLIIVTRTDRLYSKDGEYLGTQEVPTPFTSMNQAERYYEACCYLKSIGGSPNPEQIGEPYAVVADVTLETKEPAND